MRETERLQQVRRELKARFLERDRVVDGVLCAVLSGHHVLLLGPPGTAKSMLAKEVCRRIGGARYFEWLLTKFTTPEEIFGPVSLPALESGRYERVTDGKLPEAEVAFLDEIFKANSAILNALLTVLNERRYHQGSRSIPVPLQAMLAASNELPEEDELGALYDRFLLRFTVGYITGDHRFIRLLQMRDEPDADGADGADGDTDAGDAPVTALAPEDLAALRAALARIEVPETVLADILEVRRELSRTGVVASDRRYRQALDILRAAALLEDRERVTLRDLDWFEHILWSEPDEQAKVAAALSQVATGQEQEARKLLVQAQEIAAYARRAWPDLASRNRAIIEAHTKLEHISRNVEAMRESGEKRGRDTSWIDDINTQIAALQRDLLPTRN